MKINYEDYFKTHFKVDYQEASNLYQHWFYSQWAFSGKKLQINVSANSILRIPA